MEWNLLSVLVLGLGGFLGSIGRYFTGVLIHGMVPRPAMFYGTLTVNLVGCLLIGLAAGFAEGRLDAMPERFRLFAVVGFLGGFTTYSSFGLESFVFLREGRPGAAFVYVAATVVLGLASVALGFVLAGWVRNAPL